MSSATAPAARLQYVSFARPPSLRTARRRDGQVSDQRLAPVHPAPELYPRRPPTSVATTNTPVASSVSSLLESLAAQLSAKLPSFREASSSKRETPPSTSSFLPSCLVRLFVTSREQDDIKRSLTKFNPFELRIDERTNRQDIRAFLSAHNAGRFVELGITMGDIDSTLR